MSRRSHWRGRKQFSRPGISLYQAIAVGWIAMWLFCNVGGKTWEVESTSASIFLSPGNASEWRGLVQAARPYTCKCNCKYKYTSVDRDAQDEDAEDPINQETKQPAKHAEQQQQVLLHLCHQRSQLLAWIVNCSRHCASHPVKVTKPEIRNQLWNCQLDLFKWTKFKKIVSKGFSDVHILRQYLRSPKVEFCLWDDSILPKSSGREGPDVGHTLIIILSG